MLQLYYTVDGFSRERTPTSLEQLLAQRVVLAMRLGQPCHLAADRASFLLPRDVAALMQLETALYQECRATVTVVSVDDELVEVSLSGTWVAESSKAHEGLFLTVMSNTSMSRAIRCGSARAWMGC